MMSPSLVKSKFCKYRYHRNALALYTFVPFHSCPVLVLLALVISRPYNYRILASTHFLLVVILEILEKPTMQNPKNFFPFLRKTEL